MEWHEDFDKEMGKPLSDAVKTGYAYERVFEHCNVNIDLESKISSVVWNQNNALVDVSGVSITDTRNRVAVNETLQQKVNVSPLNATYQGLSWTTSHPLIANVSSDGLVKAREKGAVIIKATTSEGRYNSTFELIIK